MHITTKALVLRTTDYKESDKILAVPPPPAARPPRRSSTPGPAAECRPGPPGTAVGWPPPSPTSGPDSHRAPLPTRPEAGTRRRWRSLFSGTTLHKLREAIKTLQAKENPARYRSQITLAERRVRAFELASP